MSETAANLEVRTRRARISVITLRMVGRWSDTCLHQAKGVASGAAVTMKPPGISRTLFGLQLETDREGKMARFGATISPIQRSAVFGVVMGVHRGTNEQDAGPNYNGIAI